MDKITIYIITTGRGGFKQRIAGEYIIEIIREDHTFTYPPLGKSTLMYSPSQSPPRLTAMLLTNAVMVLEKLIEHNRLEVKDVDVFIDEASQSPFISKWYERWHENGYMNAQGNTVADSEIWESLNGAIRKTDIGYSYHTEPHSYTNIMTKQTQEELKSRILLYENGQNMT